MSVFDSPFTVTFKETTVIGVPVIQGAKGEPGTGSSAGYTFTQASPLSTWTVNHNLGYRPAAVSVLSPGGVEVEAACTHTSDNQFVITFALPYSGSVRYS